MPGAAISFPSTHDSDADADESDTEDLPENISLILPSRVESTRRDTVCLHRVTEYEQQLRLAQLQDSLIELRRVRRIRHSLLMNHRFQIAGQGQRVSTRSRTVINGIEERISKFVQRYRVAYDALVQLDPAGEWQETYCELTDGENRGPGKEDYEWGVGDGSYTISWIWLSNPRAQNAGGSDTGHGEGAASDEEVNDAMRVQWATSHARAEWWAEEVELLQEEMRRVVMFLEWRSENWLAQRDARLATAPSSTQSGLRAYAQKQAAIHHNLALSFSKLWYPTFSSYHLDVSWITKYMEKHCIPLPNTNIPASQVRGMFTAMVHDEAGGGYPQAGATPLVQLQDPPNLATDDATEPLEEASHIEDGDETEDDHSEAWDFFDRLDADDNGGDNIGNDDSDYHDHNDDDDGGGGDNSDDYGDDDDDYDDYGLNFN